MTSPPGVQAQAEVDNGDRRMNDGIPGCLGLEGTLKTILFQAEQSSPRIGCSEPRSQLALDVAKDGASPASVHSLGQWPSSRSGKEQLH